MEIVIAYILIVLSNGNLEMKAKAEMPIDRCISDARKFNADPDHPFVMFCGPKLETPTYEG